MHKTRLPGVYRANREHLTGTQWYCVMVTPAAGSRADQRKYCGGYYTDITEAEKAATDLRDQLEAP